MGFSKLFFIVFLSYFSIFSYASSIGVWSYKNISYSASVEIFEKEDKYVASTQYQDGSQGTENLMAKTIDGVKRYYVIGNRFGEYYMVNDDGSLGFYDNEGFLFNGKKVELK